MRRSDAVVENLIERIASSELAPGALIPTEPVLCTEYGVSRTVAREAVKSLEERGLVTAFQGIGTLVSGQDDWDILDPQVLAAIVRHDEQYEVLDQLVAVRTALESNMAAEAARRVMPADLVELRSLMEELGGSIREPERMDDLDVGFHQRIMSVSGNVLARAIVKTIHAEARHSTRYLGHPSLADRRVTNRQHWAILEAIADGDPETAAGRMAAHIGEAWQRRRPGKTRSASASPRAARR